MNESDEPYTPITNAGARAVAVGVLLVVGLVFGAALAVALPPFWWARIVEVLR